MDLRIDRLLALLRDDPEGLLAAVDRDPFLIKREAGGLVLANASKALFSPRELHHLFAKGIVYRRRPYRLVSLPLLKIFNLGERAVTVADVEALLSLPGASAPRIHFLRKWDGTMVQRFEADGRAWFGTRGMLEGALVDGVDEESVRRSHFDYLAAARQIAARRYPALLEAGRGLEGLTLVLELIHPEARVITDYRGLEDLILLTAFDRETHRYRTHAEVLKLADRFGLTAVDAFAPAGATLGEQIDRLLAELGGTDHEGAVVTIESGPEVVYRVKVKSPDYLRLLRLMVNCTYAETAALLEPFETLPTWAEFEATLRARGSDQVPEEVLGAYREHYDRFAAYHRDCEQVLAWARGAFEAVKATVPAIGAHGERALRKAFAQRVQSCPHRSLLFAALDGRLDVRRVREYLPRPDEAREALRTLER